VDAEPRGRGGGLETSLAFYHCVRLCRATVRGLDGHLLSTTTRTVSTARELESADICDAELDVLSPLVSTDPLIGFWSYAIAHGAQYLIFMIVLGANTKRGIVEIGLLLLAVSAAFVMFAKLNSFNAGLTFYNGIVMGHFLIDAKVWRLREPLQRQIIGERFSFLFS